MYDLIVIGAGPGGYVAAIRAAQLGMKTLVIEKDAPGGTCLNVGCIPAKTLYKDAQVVEYFAHAADYGVVCDGFRTDLELVQARKRRVVETLVNGVAHLFKANGVDYVQGDARFVSKDTLEVTDAQGKALRYQAERVLLATGSKNAMPPVPGIQEQGVITSREALSLEAAPKHLVIIGGGVIGIEFAGIYKAFGSEVTVIELLPSILPTMDGELSKRLKASLAKRGIRILTATKVEKIEKDGNALKVATAGAKAESVACDCVLVAVGRIPCTDGLGLEGIGVELNRGAVRVDENYQTSVPGVYAVGDVTGRVMLAHVASAEGVAAVERMQGMHTAVDYAQIPSAVFTFPEMAGIGLTEEQLKEKGLPYVAGKATFSGNGKALTMNDTEGMIKVLASEDLSEIYGVHILGPNASDLITEAAAAMHGMFTVEEVAQIMHGHPTLSEVFMEAVNGLLGKAIHGAAARKK
ncbi:MAG: dihydrolipoyl dehydrogenase [Christensenellaceae bacterium]|jgi:dihydrolipoamide dehydrogenase|nr:dihydrolipoyl dehydrogenase [Christensenellaceae bacterium]